MKISSKQLKTLILTEVRNVLVEHGDEPHKIVSYYETWSEEDVEIGETNERGDLDVEILELDEYDRDEGLTMVDKAVEYLTNAYAYEASSSHFHPGIWYTAYGDSDYRTGEVQNESYHLKGFSEAEEAAIFEEMKSGMIR